MQLHGDHGGECPVRSARTHVQSGGGRDAKGVQSSLLSETDPIRLTDIDRVLEASAALNAAETQADDPAAVRTWRRELTVALESLSYARSVLAGDVGILRHCLENESLDPETLVDELPRLVAGPQGGLHARPVDGRDEEGAAQRQQPDGQQHYGDRDGVAHRASASR